MGTWQKAWIPFVAAVVGLGVYFGLFTQEQAAQLNDAIVPAVVVVIQTLLVYFIPNKGGGQ